MNEIPRPKTNTGGMFQMQKPDTGPPTCPSCKSTVQAENCFCAQCGAKLEQAKPAVPEQVAPQPEQTAPVETVVPHVAPQVLPAVEPEAEPRVCPEVKPVVEPITDPTICRCTCCGQVLPKQYHYCFQCGTKVGQPKRQCTLSSIGNADNIVVSMTGPELTIGKLAECDLVIPDDDYVSRRHARLFRSDGMVFLEDTGSANGTFLRVRRPIVLESGDQILIGTKIFQFDDNAVAVSDKGI